MSNSRIAVFAALIILLLTSGQTKAEGSWTDQTKIKGDVRYRHEYVDQDGKLERQRQRLRARIGIESKIHADVKLAVQLASGSDDPVSTNQTLDDGFSTKSVGIDLAYFSWTPSNAKGFSVTGGKIKNPFYRPGGTELIWDGDLNPEGLAGGYRGGSGNTSYFVTVAGFWLDESSSSNDAGLRAAQAGLMFKTADEKTTVTAGAGIYDYSNLEGRSPIFDADDSYGNTLDASDGYMYDYNLIEFFVEVGVAAGTTPVSVFGDFVTNGDPDSANTGWLVGAKVGKAKKTGSWAGRYNYRKIERDAVLGVFTDSDFRGGGTDGEGHEFGVDVVAASKVKLGATLFVNKQNLENKNDFARFQLDANFKI